MLVENVYFCPLILCHMRYYPLFLLCIGVVSVSCIDKHLDNGKIAREYVESFSNRKTVSVSIQSENPGEFYALYYDFPYDEGSLCRQPALTGFTPVATTLDLPREVEKIYVLSQGELTVYDAGNLSITPAHRQALSRVSDTNPVGASVLTAINSIHFPETTNNVRGEDLFKCTDLKIAQTPATEPFETAEVWLTFLGDGGCRQSDLWGMLWFYTYPVEKLPSLTFADCTFYGVRNDEVVEISYDDVKAKRHWMFYTKEEFKQNVASYKRFKLGEFAKGVNIGFVYVGNSLVGNDGFRFTTPRLNPRVRNYTLVYQDNKQKFTIEDNYLANGFICHVTTDDFQGNVLGMENRLVTEGTKYDGDYNDMLCLIESNPKALEPSEEVETGNSGNQNPEEEVACKTTSGIYIFEDNYPSQGDFDFNDAVIRYEIKDYYQSKNHAKQVTVEALAKGAQMKNQFGFRNSGKFSTLLEDLSGFVNVYPHQAYEAFGEPVTQTLYGDVEPYLLNGTDHYIYLSNFNTAHYPCVMEIPLTDSDDASWQFLWPQESESIDDCYYFLTGPDGGARAKDWYRHPKNPELLFKR